MWFAARSLKPPRRSLSVSRPLLCLVKLVDQLLALFTGLYQRGPYSRGQVNERELLARSNGARGECTYVQGTKHQAKAARDRATGLVRRMVPSHLSDGSAQGFPPLLLTSPYRHSQRFSVQPSLRLLLPCILDDEPAHNILPETPTIAYDDRVVCR